MNNEMEFDSAASMLERALKLLEKHRDWIIPAR
jgi:hypothetical protein